MRWSVLVLLIGCGADAPVGPIECDPPCATGSICKPDGVCCTPFRVGCNGRDDDCDGKVDEGSGAEVGCPAGEVCRMAECLCPPERRCVPGECAPLETSSAHCGACGAACPDGGECADSSCCEIADPGIDVLSVLFVIDNGGLVLPEQVHLSEELPWLIEALTTGDVDEDGWVEMRPFVELRLGVVTTDMGTGGHVIPTCADPEDGDDGLLRTEVTAAFESCPAEAPPFLRYRPTTDGMDPEPVGEQLRCVLVTGNDEGCGFEQPLEAALKAVTPSSSEIRFAGGSGGHADGANAGFIDPEGALAIIVMDDEDDGSFADPDFLRPSGGEYEGNLLLRPYRYPEALHPVNRYVEGLLAAVAAPERLYFGVIAGVPSSLPPANDPEEYRALLLQEGMQQRISDEDPNRLAGSCNTPGIGYAFPPRRLVQVALGLHERGAATAAGSLCRPDLRPPLHALLEAMAISAGARAECVDPPPEAP